MKKSLIVTLTILLIVFSFYYFDLQQYLTLENVNQHKILFKNFVTSNYWASVLIYILGYSIISCLPLPGDSILTISGGYFFGVLPAVIYTNIAVTLGAIYIYLIFRYLAKKEIDEKLQTIAEKIKTNGANYLLALRLVPIFPVFSVNIVAGLSKINLKTFIWTTSLGILPVSTIYAWAGKNIANINSTGDILSWPIITSFVLLAGLTLLPIFLKQKTK